MAQKTSKTWFVGPRGVQKPRPNFQKVKKMAQKTSKTGFVGPRGVQKPRPNFQKLLNYW